MSWWQQYPKAEGAQAGKSGEWWKQYPEAEAKQDGPGALDFLNRGINAMTGIPALLSTGPVDVVRGLTGYDPLNEAGRQAVDQAHVPVAPPAAVPDTYAGRAAEGVGLAVGSLLPLGAAATAARTAASPVARSVAETVTRPFLSQPGRAIVVEALAGAGAGAGGLAAEREARERGVDPQLARTGGELVGGLGAAVAPGMVARGTARAVEATPLAGSVIRAGRASLLPFTKAGARVQAAKKLQGLSGAPAEDAARITGDTIGGLSPAQETGNPRLLALEGAILDQDAQLDRKFAARSQEGAQALREAIQEPATTRRMGPDGSETVERATARDAAEYLEQQQTYLRGLLEQRLLQAEESAAQAANKLTPTLKETEASSILRRELDKALKDARAQERQLWAAVPKGVTVPTTSAKEALATFRGQLGRAQLDDLPDEAVRFLDPDQGNTVFGERESVREMHALYSRLRETARQARAAGKPNQARISDGIADAVLRDLEASDAQRQPNVMADARDAWEHQQDVDGFFREYDRLSREVGSFGKRPLTQEIIRRGGVDPDSPLAQELRHAGITAQSMPGLFRKGGLRDVDNLPLDELDGRVIAAEGSSSYASRNGVIEAMADEARRQPRLTPEQQRASDELAGLERQLPEYEQMRAEMDQAGRVGAPFPGDFGAEVSGPLQAARAFSRDLNRTFRQGRVGDVLGVEREGGFSTPPETTLAQTIGTGGAKAAVAADELRAATKGGVDAEAAMRDYMRRRFTEFAAPRGDMKPERAQDFLRQNAELLDRFPDVKAEIEEAAAAGGFARDARRTIDEGLRAAEKTPTAAFINAPFEQEFQSVLNAQNPRAAAEELARRVAQDPTGQAARGLKGAAVDFLMQRAGDKPAKMRELLADGRVNAAVSSVLDANEMRRLDRVISEMEKAAPRGRLPAVDTSTGMINSALQYAANVLAARLGAQAGQGTSGASLLTANLATRRMRGMLENLSRDRAGELLKDAIQDPDLFRSLLLDASKPENARKVERRLVEWLGAETGLATDRVAQALSERGPRPADPRTADIVRALVERQAMTATRLPPPANQRIAQALTRRAR